MEGRTAVITGATSGIGAAYALWFAQDGYDLIITGRRRAVIEEFAQKLRKSYGIKVEVVIAELAKPDQVEKLIEKIRHRQVEVLVNNAGFGVNSFYQESDLEIMEQVVEVNVLTPMKLIHALLPGMIRRGRGIIINVSSESAYLSIPKNSVYSGVKAFLLSFTEGLHLDLRNTGVKVQVVCPGFTRTDFHEKMGMKKSKQRNKGLIHWMSPEKVVEISLKDLKKEKVICIPGIHTKLLIFFGKILPKNYYYKFASTFNQKNKSNSRKNQIKQ
ncbi:short-chain dehydrogenase of unknown substrate specificity [Desulfosporosinus orientis DSM 765]|uniref:Short-chain dehydrogenase n=1 Tax=Desulfosporosinus orientis (strain ATCC 19365 / DSM 765 / NCIMB 8382 / VKM B-1628 / Singapore I) TaxID=768706 RepID=G7WBD9_DESOD|nr:SDR family oxidoreductase [Desulfosporosinus orientis]AET68268.1 short-chain dehydrogenase of unknown substrate specificity [Desulfosporosinus orientis DSM 765]